MNYIYKIFLVLIIVVIWFGLNQDQVFSVTCQLTSATWSKTEANVGESLILSVNGQNCNGWNVAINIYEKDTFGNDFIANMQAKFQNDTQAFVKDFKFTSLDYQQGGNESGSEIMFFKAVAGESEVVSNELKLAQPVAGTCQLTIAKWNWTFSDQPIVGSPVQLVVNGSGCADFKVQYDIFEQDTGLGDDHISTKTTLFNAKGTQAIANWIVDGSSDDDSIGSYEFYFFAAAGNAKVQSGILQIPLNSETGCLNCNAMIQPNICECANGTSFERPVPGGDCQALCANRIGDAHGAGTGTGGGSTGSGTGGGTGGGTTGGGGSTGGGSTTLPNPIGIDTFEELVNVIGVWIFNLAIPIAVIVIIYAGILMLTAGGNPGKFQQGAKALWYAVLGLAIVFIGKGFVTLIESILSLRNP